MLALDGKGRVTVPARFRDVLVATVDGRLVVCKGPDGCLLLFPLPVWEQIEARLAALPATDRVKERYLERVSYYGQQSRLDGQGRLLVPTILRSSATMSGEVVVSARIDHLVVWNRERFEKRLAEHPFSDEDFGLLSERGI